MGGHQFRNKFRWKPSLEKHIQRHRNFLNVFIEKVNMLENHPEAPGLDLKKIKNFSRFRLNKSFRALFYERINFKEFFAFGEHDLGLKK